MKEGRIHKAQASAVWTNVELKALKLGLKLGPIKITKKRNIFQKQFLRWLYRPSKFLFLAITGPIIAYISHQNNQKEEFIPKWFLRYLY